MTHTPQDDPRTALLRYLLDEVGEKERDQLEMRLLGDRGIQEELTVAEEELADLYVTGALLPDQRKRFEKKFLGSPEWHGRIEFARAMDRVVAPLDASAAPRPAIWRTWLAKFRRSSVFRPMIALASVAVILVTWIALRPGPGHGRDNRSAIPVLPGVRSDAEPLSFLLTPATRKGGEPQQENVVNLPERPQLIEFRMRIVGELYPSYEVQLQSLTSREPVSLGSAKPRTQPDGAIAEVPVSLDSSRLQSGRYTIVLRVNDVGGITEVAGYSFRVIRIH